jgi:hypothetical protein
VSQLPLRNFFACSAICLSIRDVAEGHAEDIRTKTQNTKFRPFLRMLLSHITISNMEISELDKTLDKIVEVATSICNEVRGDGGDPRSPTRTQGKSTVFAPFGI